jgi:hypothetical protein
LALSCHRVAKDTAVSYSSVVSSSLIHSSSKSKSV